MLAVTLFAIKINGTAQKYSSRPPFHFIVIYRRFTDKTCEHSNVQTTAEEMQRCLGRVHRWTQQNCFKFSLTKTKAMNFTMLPGLHMQPELRLGNTEIPYADTVKFLGLIWDSNLTLKSHITNVRSECTKLDGMLKTITSQT